MNIRWRLALWNALALLLVLTIISICFLYQIRHHLQQRADIELMEEIGEVEEEMQRFANRQELTQELTRRFSVHSHFYFQLFEQDGNSIFQSRFLTQLDLPTPLDPSKMRGAQFQNIDLKDLGSFRQLSMAIRDSESRPMLLRAFVSRASLEIDFRRYIWMLLTLVPIGFLASLTASYFWASKALSPIKKLNDTAKSISANGHLERLFVANPSDEIGELSITLNQAFDRIAKNIDYMQRFTSDAAHELRTPVAIMKAEAEVMLRYPRNAEEYKAVVEATLFEMQRLESIVEQLLTLSRHDSQTQALPMEEVPISALIRDVVERLEPMAKSKKIELKIHELQAFEVYGDDIGLSQLFFNLIENAIKFTPEEGMVSVAATTSSGETTIEIADTGIGIATDTLPRVFDRFYRADDSRSKYRGAGLGLAICKSIAEIHRGSIRVASELGKGSQFFVTLPCHRAAALDSTPSVDGQDIANGI